MDQNNNPENKIEKPNQDISPPNVDANAGDFQNEAKVNEFHQSLPQAPSPYQQRAQQSQQPSYQPGQVPQPPYNQVPYQQSPVQGQTYQSQVQPQPNPPAQNQYQQPGQPSFQPGTQQYQQPPYGAPAQYPQQGAAAGQSDGAAITSLVLGSVSVFAFLLSIILSIFVYPWAGIIGIICGIVGLVLGIISKKKNPNSGMATAGIVVSSVGLGLSLIVTIACTACFCSAANAYNSAFDGSDIFEDLDNLFN